MSKKPEFVQYSDTFYETETIEHSTTLNSNNEDITHEFAEFDNKSIMQSQINNITINEKEDFSEYDSETPSLYKNGYDDGYKDGYEKKLTDIMTDELETTSEDDSDKIKLEIATKLEELSKNNFFDDSIVLEFVNLISTIAKKVVFSELSLNPEVIERAVLAAINELIDVSNVVIECSAADFDHMPHKDNIMININPLMEAGEFSVGCSGQRIDSTFSSKIDDVIRNAFNVSQ